jgi:ADP-ribose pyrophosphatase
MKPFETIKRQELFQGKIVDVIRDTITLPDGKTTEREVVLHGDAAAILPVDQNGNIILVRQYRHPVGKEVLEVPAGMLDPGEDPAVCAARELEEETAQKAGKITHLFTMYSSIGFCNEKLHVYLAEDLTQGAFNLDEDEFVSVEKYTLKDVTAMIFNNEIVDGKTIAAILAYQQILRG